MQIPSGQLESIQALAGSLLDACSAAHDSAGEPDLPGLAQAFEQLSEVMTRLAADAGSAAASAGDVTEIGEYALRLCERLTACAERLQLRDRREVMARVQSLRIATKMDVFLDCLSIRPGEKWKETLREEISRRDVFWLFWSRHALSSEWVDWEWRTALAEKTLDGIQPHPLEPADLAPPPPELADLQFGSLYEQMLLSLDHRLDVEW